jgi:hypothetical protein
MNTQETIVKILEAHLPMLTNAAKSTPDDKLDWKPESTARSAREVFTEAVIMLTNTAGMLNERKMPDTYEATVSAYAAMSINELITQAHTDLEVLSKAILAFPDSDFEQTLELPWGTMSFFDIMTYPYWNMMWHAGQINYIQTLYGDQQMH